MFDGSILHRGLAIYFQSHRFITFADNSINRKIRRSILQCDLRAKISYKFTNQFRLSNAIQKQNFGIDDPSSS